MDQKAKYSLFSYVFILLSVFILFVFTKDFYFSVVETKEQSKTLESQIAQKNEEYKKLTQIKTDLNNPKSKTLNINKFLVKFSEDELLEYFYTYANQNIAKVKIDNLTFSEWKLNEFGINEGQIELSATFTTEQDMIDMIQFLLKSEKYNLYIHEFNYQFGSDFTAPIKVSIPLKILYR